MLRASSSADASAFVETPAFVSSLAKASAFVKTTADKTQDRKTSANEMEEREATADASARRRYQHWILRHLCLFSFFILDLIESHFLKNVHPTVVTICIWWFSIEVADLDILVFEK